MVETDIQLIFIPKIKTRVEPDSYVEVFAPDDDNFFIGRINSVKPVVCRNGVQHVWLKKYDLMSSKDGCIVERSFSGYCINTCFNSYPTCLLCEVIMTTKFVEVPIEDVLALCFVFTPLELEEPHYNWSGGMMHVYILRYVAREDPYLPVLHMEGCNRNIQHYPFPVISENVMDYGISQTEHIWNGLFKIHTTIQSILLHWSEKQGHHSRCLKLIPFNLPHIFYYIMNLWSTHNVTEQRNGYVKRSYIMLSSGMKRYRCHGKKVHCTTLRFETSEQLNMLSRLVISVSGRFGVRRHPPMLKNTHGQLLESHYSLNYVLRSDTVETPNCQQTGKDGIDLTYISSGHLRISVCYRKFLYTVNWNGMPMSCKCPAMLDMILLFPDCSPLEEDNMSSHDTISDHEDISSDDDENSSIMSFFKILHLKSQCLNVCHPHKKSVFKITDIGDKEVNMVTIHWGNDLTIKEGDCKIFCRNDPILRAGIQEYYK